MQTLQEKPETVSEGKVDPKRKIGRPPGSNNKQPVSDKKSVGVAKPKRKQLTIVEKIDKRKGNTRRKETVLKPFVAKVAKRKYTKRMVSKKTVKKAVKAVKTKRKYTKKDVITSGVLTENAQVQETFLGHDGGHLTFFIKLQFLHSSQQFGGVWFDQNPVMAAIFIDRICTVFGVKSWEELKGFSCQAEHDGQRVYSIKHIIGGQELNVDELLKSYGAADQIKRLNTA